MTLAEGVANYVTDPIHDSTGAPSAASRERYVRNAEPSQIRENFALFDGVLRDLMAGGSWEDAYNRGFSSRGMSGAHFYFVGYEMAKAIDRDCGSSCVARLFQQRPAEFLRRYVALYKRRPDIPGRFSAETEAFIQAGAK